MACALVGTLALAGCSGGDDSTSGESGGSGPAPATDGSGTGGISGEISFTWWGNDERAAMFDEALAVFKEQNPDVTINTQFAAFPDYWTARATEAAGNSLPDLMLFDSAYLRQYTSGGKLADLTPFIDSGAIDTSGYEASLVEAGNLGGTQAAIPVGTNTLALFSAPTLIEKLGVPALAEDATWEDLNAFDIAAKEAGKKTDENYDIYGSQDHGGTFWVFLQWLVQKDIQPFSDDGKIAFTQDDIKEYLNVTKEPREKKAVFPAERLTALSPIMSFDAGESAYEISWDNFLSRYEESNGMTDLKLQPVPSGPNGPKLFMRPAMHYAISENSDNKDAAAALLNFLITDTETAPIFGTNAGVPGDAGRRDALNPEPGSVDARVIEYEESVADIATEKAPIPVDGFGTIEEKWRVLGEELVYGTITVDEFASQWWDEAERTVKSS